MVRRQWMGLWLLTLTSFIVYAPIVSELSHHFEPFMNSQNSGTDISALDPFVAADGQTGAHGLQNLYQND